MEVFNMPVSDIQHIVNWWNQFSALYIGEWERENLNQGHQDSLYLLRRLSYGLKEDEQKEILPSHDRFPASEIHGA